MPDFADQKMPKKAAQERKEKNVTSYYFLLLLESFCRMAMVLKKSQYSCTNCFRSAGDILK
jgi:hypothetical protein